MYSSATQQELRLTLKVLTIITMHLLPFMKEDILQALLQV